MSKNIHVGWFMIGKCKRLYTGMVKTNQLHSVGVAHYFNHRYILVLVIIR